jgi:hypothetical protein
VTPKPIKEAKFFATPKSFNFNKGMYLPDDTKDIAEFRFKKP